MRHLTAIKHLAAAAAPWAGAALGFSLPLSTALDSVLVVAVLVFWVLGGDFKTKFSLIRKNETTLPVLLIFVVYAVGMLYSLAEPTDVFEYFSKGARILLIPLLLPLFQEKRVRQFALGGFQAAAVIVLIISCGIWSGLLPAGYLFKGTPEDPVVFRLHITHSLLMAFAAYLFAVTARYHERWLTKVTAAMLCLFFMMNVFFMVPGRTGQLVFVLLLLYFFFSVWRWRGATMAACIVLLVFLSGVFMPSSAIRRGVDKLTQEYREWTPGTARTAESAKLRLDFYTNSMKIVRDHPVFGVGTGGFAKAYEATLTAPNAVRTDNPHNEYLLIAVQFGLVGLGVWLFLFFRQWLLAARLPLFPERLLARGLVIVILTASLVSSTLVDHTEGLFYFWACAIAFAPLTGGREATVQHDAIRDCDH